MSDVASFTDGLTGTKLWVSVAQLPQDCPVCDAPMQGEAIYHTDGQSWRHAKHMGAELTAIALTLPGAPGARPRVEARVLYSIGPSFDVSLTGACNDMAKTGMALAHAVPVGPYVVLTFLGAESVL